MMPIYLIYEAKVKERLPHQTDHWFSCVIWDILILYGTFSNGTFSDGTCSDGTCSDGMFIEGTFSDGTFCMRTDFT